MRAHWLYKIIFRFLNGFIVVPAFRLGLGRVVSNPITGRIMLLVLKGRRSKKTRFTPVGYAIIGGKIYCYRGGRLRGAWYLNLMANPYVEVILPNRRLKGYAEEVNDSAERIRAIRQILKNGGLTGFVYGFNPWTAGDDLIEEKMRGIEVVRITPESALEFQQVE